MLRMRSTSWARASSRMLRSHVSTRVPPIRPSLHSRSISTSSLMPVSRLRLPSNCTEGGNNYEACIVTAQNALKDYPYSNKREEFATLIMKSKYELAKMSVESKQLERYQDAEDECYGFINEYPDSKERATAEKYIEKCKEFEKAHPEDTLEKLAGQN